MQEAVAVRGDGDVELGRERGQQRGDVGLRPAGLGECDQDKQARSPHRHTGIYARWGRMPDTALDRARGGWLGQLADTNGPHLGGDH